MAAPHPHPEHVPSGPRDEARDLVRDLFEAHYARLCRFVHRLIQSPAVAEELVQDVFLKIWKQQQEQAAAPLVTKAYLYQAARNRALDYLKRQKLEHAWLARREREPDAADDASPVDDGLHCQELADAVRRAVDRLPERCRLVFLLRREHDLSHEEIAQALGITVKTVENQMGRALRTLRQRLMPYLSIGALVGSAAEVLRIVR